MLSTKEIFAKRKIFHDTDSKMVLTFKVLSDVNRYRIFRILAAQPKLSVSDIAQILKISLPLASQHIKILELSALPFWIIGSDPMVIPSIIQQRPLTWPAETMWTL